MSDEPIFKSTKCCKEIIISDKQFGISDLNERKPCIVDTNTDNKTAWDITINNDQQKTIIFNAIDFCVDIRRDNGDQDNICDACIRYDDTIVFIEIKHKNRGWLKEAMHQICNTIQHFKKNNTFNFDSYEKRKAYIVNKRHITANTSRVEILEEMKEKYSVVPNIFLSTECTID